MTTRAATGEQAEVIAFLSDAARRGDGSGAIEVVETHGALVFLGRDEALKIKRAVRLAYLDFSTLGKREAACRREIEVNRESAPEIYRGVVAITREADGSLALGGDGEPIEWAVRMVRFPESDVLSSVAKTRGVDEGLARGLADMAIAAHRRAVPVNIANAAQRFEPIIDSIDATFAGTSDGKLVQLCSDVLAKLRRQLARNAALIDGRGKEGYIRRCHGDMHLGNIVLWKGRPTLFDAIEFDEGIATIDVLYDLAFLIMDLDRQGEDIAAHLVLDRYLFGAGANGNLAGLAALPFFVGLRAAIRAMVATDRAKVQMGEQRAETGQQAAATLRRALGYLDPPRPRLVAVGGLSGTGKSTLAKALAPAIGATPGALHVRSDVLRKRLAGVAETERLNRESYTAEASARVYERLCEIASVALVAGHSVIADAVFQSPEQRSHIEAVARRLDVPFAGVWLEAGTDTLKARVTSRTGDASDADAAVVDRQLAGDKGEVGWVRISADGTSGEVLEAVQGALGIAHEAA